MSGTRRWRRRAGPNCIDRCGTFDYGAMNLVVRTALPPERLAAEVKSALRPIDPNLPVRAFETLQALVAALAGYFPARRSQIDPIVALRAELNGRERVD
jgi:hypothetical protein